MYILVNHVISMPAEFWGSAQLHVPNLPEGGVKRVVTVFPNENMDQCTCVWEAESIETLDSYLRDKIGNASKDSFYRINEANAVGLNL